MVGGRLTDASNDSVSGSLTADTSAVNAQTPGTYTATITATDTAGFAATPVTVTVIIEESGLGAG